MFHAYVRTDREGNERVGGSTQPDPKWLREDGTVYRPG